MARAPINPTNITPPRVPLIDDRTGAISREWYRWLLSLFDQVEANSTGVIDALQGPGLLGIVGSFEATTQARLAAAAATPRGPSMADITQLQSSVKKLEAAPPQNNQPAPTTANMLVWLEA